MATRSQNGWLGLSTSALQSKYLTTITIPGTDPVRRFRVRRGNVARVFAWIITEFHRNVESLNEGHPNDDWSFHYRAVRGSGSLSNHSSGTAVDLNATQHPLGTSPEANFTHKQRHTIRDLLNETKVGSTQVIRWGGDYSGRKDPMHFEINAGPSHVATLAKRISAPTRQTGDWFDMATKKDLEDAIKEHAGRAVLYHDAIPAVPPNKDNPTWQLRTTINLLVRQNQAMAKAIEAMAADLPAATGQAVREALAEAVVEVDVNVTGGGQS